MENLLESTKIYLESVSHQPPIHTMTPEEVRKMRATPGDNELTQQAQLNKIENKWITVRDGENIPIRIYTPSGDGPFPIIVYYHGGGWVLNDIETCDASCQRLAAETNSLVISVGYRLAPEYPFPLPVYDAYDAFLWTVDHSKVINGLPNELTVMGDSAGGNLATVVTMMNKNLHGHSIKAQVLLYPVTDVSFSTDSYFKFSEGYGLQKKDMEWFAQYYIQDKELYHHPYVSPIRASDLTELPDAYIIVAENDVLKDEGISYAHSLENSGNLVKLQIAHGLVHSFFTKNDFFALEIDATIESVKSFLENL